MQARSAFGSRSSSLYLLLPTPPALARQSLAQLVAPGRSRGKPVFYMYNTQVLHTESSHPTLPVAIQKGMPHITLQLGTVLNDTKSPCIRCVLDTAAALCTSNYHFFAAIAKRYLHCVVKIYLPEDYSPIILSGIVQDNKPIGAAPQGHFFVGGGGGVWAKKFGTLRGLRIPEKKEILRKPTVL